MDKSQKKYITKNLIKLIDCTKNISELSTSLMSSEFISNSTWQKIFPLCGGVWAANVTLFRHLGYAKKENLDDFTLVKEIYMECMKTPAYDLLIECLEETDNGNAANILKNIDQAGNVQSQQSCQDFTVSDNALYKIVDLFKKDNLWGDRWTEVQKLILSPSALSTVTEESNFGIRVLKDLQAWKKFRGEKATFSILHELVNGINPEAAGILMTAKSDIMKSD